MGYEWQFYDNYTVAAYAPRALYIRLNFPTLETDEAELQFSRPTFSIFMHEVAHLVQDRATIFGVTDFLHFYQSFSSVHRYVDSFPDGQRVIVPARQLLADGCLPGSDVPLWISQEEELRRATYSRHDWPVGDTIWAFRGHDREMRRYELGYKRFEVPVVTARWQDNISGEEITRPLGAWEVKEAYSVAVQIAHGGDTPVPSDDRGFEYLAVERIVTSLFGEVQPQQLIVLCHWALQDASPASRLMDLLDRIHEAHDYQLPAAEQLYEFCRTQALEDGYLNRTHEICDELDARAAQHAEVNRDGSLHSVLSWYATEARRYLLLNANLERRFPLDTFLAHNSRLFSDADLQRHLGVFYTEVPIPMIEKLNGVTLAVGGDQISDGAVFYIRSLSRLINALWSGSQIQWRCPVFDACPHSIKDETCTIRPWDKGLLQETCSFGAASKYLGLAGRSFQRIGTEE